MSVRCHVSTTVLNLIWRPWACLVQYLDVQCPAFKAIFSRCQSPKLPFLSISLFSPKMGGPEELKIPSSRNENLQIALSVYSPEEDKSPLPVIVMGHGIGAIQAAGLEPFALAFAASGYCAITFDYLHFGKSDGEPRNFLSVPGELQDFRDVISWARQQTKRFDSQRIIVWGTSFGGMHTTALLASDHNLAGGIAQCPCVDSFAAMKMQPLLKNLRLMLNAVCDRIGAFFGKEPLYVGLAGDGLPGSPISLMEGPEVVEGWQRITPSNIPFPNKITARSLLGGSSRPVLDVKKIQKPYLIVLPTWDNEAPLGAAETAVRETPLGEALRVPGGHFDVYAGGIAFDENLSGQLAFLRRILG